MERLAIMHIGIMSKSHFAIDMNPGKIFEQDIRSSIPDDVHYTRLRDPILKNKGDGSGYTFGDRCPYDCIIYRYPHQYCLELKSTAGTSISYYGASPMIKAHQIEELAKAASHPGVIAGLVLNYRKSGRTWFVDIRDFQCYADASTKKSLNQHDCESIGTEIHAELKRVHYHYDLSPLFRCGQERLEA